MAAHGWQERERPPRLERRIEFPNYEALRATLDRIAALSERMDIYPNQRFGRDFANLTLLGDDETGELTDPIRAFALAVDELIDHSSEA